MSATPIGVAALCEEIETLRAQARSADAAKLILQRAFRLPEWWSFEAIANHVAATALDYEVCRTRVATLAQMLYEEHTHENCSQGPTRTQAPQAEADDSARPSAPGARRKGQDGGCYAQKPPEDG